MTSETISSPDHGRRLWRTALITLLVAPSILMAGALARGAVPYFMDTLMYFFPLRVHAAHMIRAGHLPIWNDCIMGGTPVFANPQAALLYPLHWPFLLFPTGFWFLFPMTLQLGFYAAATAWAIRWAGAGRPAALWAGALALAGAYGWSRFQYGNYLNVLPWFPVWLGMAFCFCREKCENPQKIINTNNANAFLFGTFAVALMILGGAQQLCAYGMAMLALIATVHAIAGRRRDWIVYLIGTYVFGVLISAPGWLPQLQFMRETSRAAGADPAAVLTGTIRSFRELWHALAGDPSLTGGKRPQIFADAEISTVIGPAALIIAMAPPPKNRRTLWAACWTGAILSSLLTQLSVMKSLIETIPLAAIFHGPRRWLGVTQWLLILAAGLSADGIFIRFSKIGVGRKIFGIALAMSVTQLALWTHQTTDFSMIPAKKILEPETRPLIFEANLKPGERFFTMDYTRASSYDYRRPDLLDWMLPNLGQIWDLEDFGGYEPAQTVEYRAALKKIHEAEPWRQPYPRHFGHIQNPASPELRLYNIGAAIMPRFGVPMFFRAKGKGIHAAHWPKIADPPFDFIILMDALPDSPAPAVYVKTASGRTIPVKAPAPVLLKNSPLAGDLTLGGHDPSGNWRPPGEIEHLSVSRLKLEAPEGEEPASVFIALPPGARLADGFFWNATLSEMWSPAASRGIPAVMHACFGSDGDSCPGLPGFASPSGQRGLVPSFLLFLIGGAILSMLWHTSRRPEDSSIPSLD